MNRRKTPAAQYRSKGECDFLALQSCRLPLHVFHHDVKDFAKGSAVFKNLPGTVGVKVELDQRLVANGEQAVALKGCGDVVEDFVLAELLTREQELSVIFEFENAVVSFG